MLISHKHKFIYTKTPKTAGTTVEVYFDRYCAPKMNSTFPRQDRDMYEGKEGIIGFRGTTKHLDKKMKWYNHMDALQVKKQIGDEIWEDYFKFSTIRSPFDYMVSLFYYLQRHAETTASSKIESQEEIKKREVGLFRHWLKTEKRMNGTSKYYSIDHKPCMDYHIRYENLEGDIQEVCNELSIEFIPQEIKKLKTKFRNRNIPLSEFYDLASIEIIEARYDFEIKHFGYSFERSLEISKLKPTNH